MTVVIYIFVIYMFVYYMIFMFQICIHFDYCVYHYESTKLIYL